MQGAQYYSPIFSQSLACLCNFPVPSDNPHASPWISRGLCRGDMCSVPSAPVPHVASHLSHWRISARGSSTRTDVICRPDTRSQQSQMCWQRAHANKKSIEKASR